MSADRKITAHAIAKLIQDLGYRATVEKRGGIDLVASTAAGLKFIIAPAGDDLLQFSLGMTSVASFRLDEVNRFNGTFRFGKVYLDDDGDIVLHWDVLVTEANLKSSLGRCLDIWELLVGALLQVLRDGIPQEKPTKKKAARRTGVG